MLIIPVIDIHAGTVVHARRGKRESYKGLQSPLCHGSEPASVVRALQDFYPFTTMYLADLNAIRGEGDNSRVVLELLHEHPEVCFWLDSGKRTSHASTPRHRLRPVIGSETGVSRAQLQQDFPELDTVLSLDFLDNKFIGDRSLLENNVGWPDDVITMSLDLVGTAAGPDFDRLAQIQAIANGKRVYAAGGIRNEDDLRKLQVMGLSGALLATALHAGSITVPTLLRYSTPLS